MSAGAQPLVLRDDWEHRGVRGVLLQLNRPASRNPLDHATISSLHTHLDEIEARPILRGLIITGVGKSFSAGGDLRKYLDLYASLERFSDFLEDFLRLCERLERGPLVTCAMINGACVAGGLELALACDFITMSDTARIGDGHLGSGQLPGGGGSQRLGRAIGWQKAREWGLTGRLYCAEDAEKVGLTTLVTSPDLLEQASRELVAASGGHSPLAYRRMKQLIRIGQETPLDVGLRRELEIVRDYATTSHDAVEGLHAFLDKRSPEYRGT